MAKEVKYSSRKGDDVEKLSEKLTVDLRQHIRKLVSLRCAYILT